MSGDKIHRSGSSLRNRLGSRGLSGTLPLHDAELIPIALQVPCEIRWRSVTGNCDRGSIFKTQENRRIVESLLPEIHTRRLFDHDHRRCSFLMSAAFLGLAPAPSRARFTWIGAGAECSRPLTSLRRPRERAIRASAGPRFRLTTPRVPTIRCPTLWTLSNSLTPKPRTFTR